MESTSATAAPVVATNSKTRVLFASLVGTTIEFFDFISMQLLPLSFFHTYFSLPVVVVPQSYNHLQLLQSPLLPVLSVQHYLGI